MPVKNYCDVCNSLIEGNPEHQFQLNHGAQVFDIRVGLNGTYKGIQCVPCIVKGLKLIADHGMFVGRKITLPETIKPETEALAEKVSWVIR